MRHKKDIATKDLTPATTNLFPRSFSEYPEIVRGEDVYIFDSNGNRYFDAVAGNQCSNIGHGVSEIGLQAKEQMEKLEYTSSILFINDQSQRFAERIADFLPAGFNHTWMVSGGSEANESAIKMARQYHIERGNTEKHIVIGRQHSYHGNTLGALSASGLGQRRKPYEVMLHDWAKAPEAYPYRCRFCNNQRECERSGSACAEELEQAILDVGPERVSAFIAEPVVGSALGAVAPGDEYFDVVRDICHTYDVLLIVDEVMSGMGRTGENFAIEQWGVSPDIITCAKGMGGGYTQIGGTFPHESVVEVFEQKGSFDHGHTYSFNPTTSAVGTAVIEYMNEKDIVANANKVGEYVQDRLKELYQYNIVGDVRGKGLMLGVEFVGDRETKQPLRDGGEEFRQRLFQVALEERIIVYPGGGSIDGNKGDHVLLTPPLSIDIDQSDEMMGLLHSVFERMDEEFSC